MAFEFARLLRSALARRLAYVLVAAALAWFGIGRAHAQAPNQWCTDSGIYGNGDDVHAICSTREQAYAEAQRAIDAHWYNDGAQPVKPTPACYDRLDNYMPGCGASVRTMFGFKSVSRYYVQGCPPEMPWDEATHTCKKPKDCSTEPDLGAGQYLAADSQICSGGCQFSGAGELCVGMTIDAQQAWYCSAWKPTGQTCSAGEGDTPQAPADGDGDGSSDGNDTSPNNPGQGGGGKDGKPHEDGGGKGDGNGSGEGSGNGNTSGGGGDCASPPSSSGDAILAQIAYQTWATRCSIEGAKDGSGNLKTTQGGSGTGSDAGDGSGDGTDFGTSNPGQDEAFDPADVRRFGIPVNTSMLDSEPIFGGGTCPVLSVTIYGKTFSTNEIHGWCDLLRILRALVLIFAAFTALRILMGNNA